jgi:flagellar export protein FliJ
MKPFHFPLERVLEFRRLELELAETRFKKEAATLAELDRRHAELEAEGIRTEIQVREWKPVSGSDLAALGGFQLRIRMHEQDMDARRAACREELAKRQGAMLEARRRLRLLERLKERRLAEWKTACNHELEDQASLSYLARWSGRQ